MNETEIIYLTKKRKAVYLILELYIASKSEAVSKLLCVYPDWDKTVMFLSDLNTLPEYRRQGYATQLIRRAIWEARRNGCTKIKLDDCSDGFNTEHNIYLKTGFTYRQKGLPEMILNL
jgi:GNAT superfamily N-acetyltransferase